MPPQASTNTERCPWCGSDPDYVAYHDTEWGVPVRDDRTHFEFLILEGAQAGLSWLTILRRRQGYRNAFAGFDAESVARMTGADIERHRSNPQIIRNRLKIESTVSNARAFLSIQEEFGSFDSYVWKFVDGLPIQNHWTSLDQIPASTPLSLTLSKDLKARGFRFVGPTIVYAHMQATGLINDHLVRCFRYGELGGTA